MPDAEGNYTEEELKGMSPEELMQLQKQNCIFCKIASKEIKAIEIYDDDKVTCVLDINPASKGHVLIIPKEHYQILPQLPADLMNHLFLASQHISQAQLKGLQAQGTTIFVANGAAAGQRAPHFLIHVIPRDQKDGLFSGNPQHFPPEQIAQVRKVLALQLNKFLKGNTLKVPAAAPVPIPASVAMPAVTVKETGKEQQHEEENPAEEKSKKEDAGENDEGDEVELEEKEDKKSEMREKIEEENKKDDPKAEKRAGYQGVDLDSIARLFSGGRR